jgi:hypothetical protein
MDSIQTIGEEIAGLVLDAGESPGVRMAFGTVRAQTGLTSVMVEVRGGNVQAKCAQCVDAANATGKRALLLIQGHTAIVASLIAPYSAPAQTEWDAIETVILDETYGVTAWRSKAGTVTVASAGSTTIPAGSRWTQQTFGTLPDGWRPPATVMSSATVGGVAGYLAVTTAGVVSWVRSTASTSASALYHSVTFVAKPATE